MERPAERRTGVDRLPLGEALPFLIPYFKRGVICPEIFPFLKCLPSCASPESCG